MNRHILIGLLATLVVLAGCATTGSDSPSLRDEIAADKAAFKACAAREAKQMIETTDFEPQTVATTALARCDSHWQDYTAGLQLLYTRQTRNSTYGHLQSRSEGFELNHQVHREIRQRAEKARAGDAERGA